MSNIEEILRQITDAPDIGQQYAESRACEVSSSFSDLSFSIYYFEFHVNILFIKTVFNFLQVKSCINCTILSVQISTEGTEYTVDQLLEEAFLAEAATKVPNICEGGDFQYFAGSSASILQPCEEPEALSLPRLSELEYPLPMEGNYVEIHDFLDPIKTCVSGIEDTARDNLPQSFIEGLSVPEHYHDASVQELDFFNGMDANQLDDLLLMNSLDSGNLYHHNPEVVTSELWSHDQNLNTFVSAESGQCMVVPPVSGIDVFQHE